MTQKLKHQHSEMKTLRSDPMKTLKFSDDGSKKSRCCLAPSMCGPPTGHQRLFLE